MSDGAAANASGSSSQAQETRVQVEIVVQPPVAVGQGRRLIPPVVARTDHARLVEDYLSGKTTVFATIMLTASDGNDATASLQGNYQKQGQPITVHPDNSSGGGSSSSRQAPHKWIYFIFSDLSISVPGEYTFTVCVNNMVHAEGCVITVAGKASRAFNVLTQAVAPGRPSKLIVVSAKSDRLDGILNIFRSFRAAGPPDAGGEWSLQSMSIVKVRTVRVSAGQLLVSVFF